MWEVVIIDGELWYSIEPFCHRDQQSHRPHPAPNRLRLRGSFS